jgi:UDP-N-acetylglucosamine diphosphorylase / glucose-1-phosphate thymidylyltransferase / UDP-N-acetylgalactosamine diphosphorylase / glucosamine-1-phosphate N-acetyltransferase / galactosamine-1-phosphate N-acetyltransferase
MQAVVIAAGESKRFWPLNNGIHKSQFKLLGKPLIHWTLKGLVENGITDVMVVVSANSSVQGMLATENDLDLNISYAVQEEPLGTGNALWQAKDFIKEPFILLWGNKAGSGELVRQMLERRKENNTDAVLVGTEVENPQEYGIFRFEGKEVREIVENPKQGEEPSRIAFVGARLLGEDFFGYYEKLSSHHEADLVDATNAYMRDKKVSFVLTEDAGVTLKYPWDLFGVMDSLLVSQKPYISASAKIGKNTVIDGPVYIGENCVIGHGNVIRGPVNIETNCKTGAFMEIKHSIIQEGTTFHAGYAGDSIIGKNCKFGAGFITGNLRIDKKPIHGFSKLGAVIGDNSMFGIHSGTMPGVLIGPNCKVGPATQVFENIEDNTTIYAKFDHVKKQQGFGLIMLILGVGIIALLAFGGFRLLGSGESQLLPLVPLKIHKDAVQQIEGIQDIMDAQNKQILKDIQQDLQP